MTPRERRPSSRSRHRPSPESPWSDPALRPEERWWLNQQRTIGNQGVQGLLATRGTAAGAGGATAPSLTSSSPAGPHFLETRAPGVWLVSDPSRHRSSIVKKLPAHTRVIITERGDSEPFNQVSDDRYKWVEVRVTTGPDMGLTGWVMQTWLRSRPETQTVSQDNAVRLFNELANATFVTASGEELPIPFHYPPDGCYARAHLMMELLSEKGYASRKVFAVSRTSSGGPGLRVATDYADDVPVGDEPAVRWWYHVAPIIQVIQEDGSVSDMVLDPAMTNQPVSVERWTSMMSDDTFDDMTIEEVADLVTRGGGNYPSGRSIVYRAGRHAYGPFDFGSLTEADSEAAHSGSGHSRISEYATMYAPAHELAASIRRELRRDPVDGDRLHRAVRTASDTAREGLRLLFPNLLRELERARDHGRLSPERYDEIRAALSPP